MSKATIRRLGSLDLFTGCRRRTLNEIDALGCALDVEPGRVLCRHGERAAEFFVLVSGLVEVHNAGGAAAILRPGAWFGETALLDNGFRRATVVARTRATVLVYSKRELDRMMGLAPTVRSRLQVTCARVVGGDDPSERPWYQPLPQGFRSIVYAGNAAS